MMEKLEIKEVSSGLIDFRELQPLQPETYKKLGSRGFDRMWNALGAKGFRVPFQVWKSPDDGTVFILDGHQRRTFINALKDRGIPMEVDGQETFMVPVVYIFAESKKDAAEMLLAIDSQYGDRDVDGMLDFMDEYDIDKEWMEGSVAFDHDIENMAKFLVENGGDDSTTAKDPFDDKGIEGKSKYGVIVECESAGTQESVFNDLTGMGYNCKIVVV
jgi:hypothetical protein